MGNPLKVSGKALDLLRKEFGTFNVFIALAAILGHVLADHSVSGTQNTTFFLGTILIKALFSVSISSKVKA
jgi:uncharacterized membrane protein